MPDAEDIFSLDYTRIGGGGASLGDPPPPPPGRPPHAGGGGGDCKGGGRATSLPTPQSRGVNPPRPPPPPVGPAPPLPFASGAWPVLIDEFVEHARPLIAAARTSTGAA